MQTKHIKRIKANLPLEFLGETLGTLLLIVLIVCIKNGIIGDQVCDYPPTNTTPTLGSVSNGHFDGR